MRFAHPCALLCGRSRRLVCGFFRARVPPQRPPQEKLLSRFLSAVAAASPSPLPAGAAAAFSASAAACSLLAGAALRLPPLAHSLAVRAGGVGSACLVCSSIPQARAFAALPPPQQFSFKFCGKNKSNHNILWLLTQIPFLLLNICGLPACGYFSRVCLRSQGLRNLRLLAACGGCYANLDSTASHCSGAISRLSRFGVLHTHFFNLRAVSSSASA